MNKALLLEELMEDPQAAEERVRANHRGDVITTPVSDGVLPQIPHSMSLK